MKNIFREYARLFRFIRPHLGILWVAALSMFVCSLMGSISIGMIIPFVDKIVSGKQIALAPTAAIPPFFSGLIDRLNAIEPLSLLKLLIVFGIALFLVKQVFEYLKTYSMNKMGYLFLKDIMDEVYGKILNLSLDFFYKNPTGKLTSKILLDTAIIKDSLIEGLTDLIYQPIQLIFYMGVIIIVKVWFGIPIGLVLASLGLTILIVYPIVVIGRRIRKITLVTQEKVADINTAIFEAITGISIVKAFSMQGYEMARLKKKNFQYYKVVMKGIKRMIAIGPITEFIGFLCSVLVIWVGVRKVITQNLSPGAFIAFFASLLSLLKPFKRMGRIYVINQRAMAAADRVFEILDTVPAIVDKPAAVRLDGFVSQIAFEGLWFKYEEKDVLKDVNLKIKKGEIAAFVGPSGVGKTTLINLVPRFYDPYKGALKIDGKDIRDVTVSSLRGLIGIVTQDTILFNDTVAQNIAYGREVKPIMEEIIKAAKAANCHDFIMKMPDGYETIVGERGFRLSGGEKQRICIARAIFKNPPILILDEATSQLDTESELLVQGAIDRLMSGRTVLVIAHRLSTIKHANSIYVLEGGRILESGSHEELMVKSGLYNKLYNLQFKLT
ncbi:MAG: ABC transporter ATP-binding protein [Candidatus Omnitrophica bacterium]|nr:ABC transporter ATP-binding protein [Candidatus Omnitrophota bacterium]